MNSELSHNGEGRNGAAFSPRTRGAIPAGDSAGEVSFHCDLSEAHSFFPYLNSPPVPVLAAFGKHSLHQCHLEGSWDFSLAVRENPEALLRSTRQLLSGSGRDKWDNLIFQFGERRFLCASPIRLVGYGATVAEAEECVRQFAAAYATVPPDAGGRFQLIRKEFDDFRCEDVSLGPETHFSKEALCLRYPTDGWEWHCGFVEKLSSRSAGLSLLEGLPGTGKTTYLRHLMAELKQTHRFYYIPPSGIQMLSQPDFVGFWAEQRNLHQDSKLIVILEDADSAVMARGADNREEVSALLNLTDGMLGDFLALQIICTINCRADEIDRALLRPGRLLTHRIFQKLKRPEALDLAAVAGTNLPEGNDFSLAEIFSGKQEQKDNHPRIGFTS